MLAAIAFLVATLSPQPGVTWDEPSYVAQGARLVNWLGRAVTLDASADDVFWTGAQPDHPPFGKLAYGLATAMRPRDTSELTAARAAAAFLFAVLVWLTTYAADAAFGERTSWFAGAGLILMPQVLAHSQLAGVDLPMAVTWVAAATVSLLGPKGWRGAALLGFLWGLALLTKFNGILLAAPLLAWGFASERLRWADVPVLFAVAAATFFAGWPWLWNDPLGRGMAYVLEKQGRWIVPTLYMGEVYDKAYPPWHYPLVLTAITVPVTVLIGTVAGVWTLARRRAAPGVWIALHLLFTLGFACAPGVPRYDGTRLFLSAFPFLAIVAAVGVERLVRFGVSFGTRGTLATATLLTVAVGSAVWSMYQVSPCLLSAYSPIVGGLNGAERRGFEATFWGDAITPELLKNIPRGARVGVLPMGVDYARALHDYRLLPTDVAAAPEDRCDVLVILGRKSMLGDQWTQRLQTSASIAETRRDGVVLARIVASDRRQ